MNTNEKLDASLWVRNYGSFLYHYASKRLNDPETANDLVQETFLSGLEKAHTFEGKCSELTWLRTILTNKIIDHYRKRSSGLSSLLELRDPTRHPDEVAGHNYDRIIEKEFHAILDACMKRLPALWMVVFKMKHLDHEQTEVICERLQISTANYWVIAHRAKLRVREYLRHYWHIPVLAFLLSISVNTSRAQRPADTTHTLLEDVVITAANRNPYHYMGQADIKMRGVSNSQEVLRIIPGLFIGQHQGGGKAEQIFLRGFDNDHGTDINLSVDGLPINMVSHAHGQGYADSHFIIPETIAYTVYEKGMYNAEKGDLAVTGYAEFHTLEALEKDWIKAEAGARPRINCKPSCPDPAVKKGAGIPMPLSLTFSDVEFSPVWNNATRMIPRPDIGKAYFIELQTASCTISPTDKACDGSSPISSTCCSNRISFLTQ